MNIRTYVALVTPTYGSETVWSAEQDHSGNESALMQRLIDDGTITKAGIYQVAVPQYSDYKGKWVLFSMHFTVSSDQGCLKRTRGFSLRPEPTADIRRLHRWPQ